MGRPTGQSESSGTCPRLLVISRICPASLTTSAAPLSVTMWSRSAGVSSGLIGTGVSPLRKAAATIATTAACRRAASAAG